MFDLLIHGLCTKKLCQNEEKPALTGHDHDIKTLYSFLSIFKK